MGLLEFFGKAPNIKKHAARAGNKRAQDADRLTSLHVLAKAATNEKLTEELRRDAVEGLIGRFSFRRDPSITDQEEKDLAMNGIVGAGALSVQPVRGWLMRSDSIAWPVKMLQRLLKPEELIGLLLQLTGEMDTEYERDPQKKVDVLAQLEDHQDPRILPAIQKFVEDVNETVRFHAVSTMLAQENPEAGLEPMLKILPEEESVRVRVQVLNACIEHDWDLGDQAAAIQSSLPDGYALDGSKVRKKR